ncbi:DNA-binding response regulator, OmpR family, contains REC and winged-helix (wHTH) domain [Clostridium cavendishii DSM 21758]|uniref:Stage 0 sporulation protein A homolog n=1 Tax=Clostridium cavendishii DSM 21758 TaxID=1121302 RepID=A0A1M6V163_9CLOT|nr:response regulator transcription factor [Clostridium cavendishii]SHK75257.1 DNA-binding response regulator, OmpR family, contains REC and winged-helix (wHTH) domain [Clostridium cavendishii DSM 21758]
MDKILVVEDDFSINDILTYSLGEEGYKVKGAFSANEFKKCFKEFEPSLVILDINLPDENGFELCKYINLKSNIPILMITARDNLVDKVLGLELGADDYITKPFQIKEVLTRVKVALRSVNKYRVNQENNDFIKVSNVLKINLDSRLVIKNGNDVKLNPKEYEILSLFVNNRNVVFSREKLLDKVWGYDYFGDDRTVDVHIRRLRSKIDTEEISHIETIFGVGYVMR